MTEGQKPTKRIGRPTKPPPSGGRVMLGLRVTPAAKRMLDEAAQRAGRSQSQEAELRLERTFLEEDQFGGPDMLNMAWLLTGAFRRGGQAGARARGHPEWAPGTWMEDPTCYLAAVSAVGDALVASGPVGLKFGDDVPVESRDLSDKIHNHFAQLIARGRDIKVTTRGE